MPPSPVRRRRPIRLLPAAGLFGAFWIGALSLGACRTAAPALSPPVAASPWGLDVGRLPRGVQTSDMAMHLGETTRSIGTAEYVVGSATDGADRLTIAVTQRVPQGEMRDTLVVAAPSGRPLRYRNAFGTRQTIRVDYGPGGRITGRTTREGAATERDTTVQGALVDAAQLLPLLAALPLDPGQRLTLPTYDYQSGTVRLSHVEVAEGRAPGTDRAAWAVRYTTTSGVVSTVWMDRATRRFQRIEADLGGGRRYVEVFR